MQSVLNIDGSNGIKRTSFAVPAVHYGYLSASCGRECHNTTQLF